MTENAATARPPLPLDSSPTLLAASLAPECTGLA